MQNVYEFIWIIGEVDSEGKFRGMHKVAGETFYLSADNAFVALKKMHAEIAKSFAVFEIKIDEVFKMMNPKEEGLSLCPIWDKLRRDGLDMFSPTVVEQLKKARSEVEGESNGT